MNYSDKDELFSNLEGGKTQLTFFKRKLLNQNNFLMKCVKGKDFEKNIFRKNVHQCELVRSSCGVCSIFVKRDLMYQLPHVYVWQIYPDSQ